MVGTVTGLRFQKRNKNRVNVYLDGDFAFGLAAVEAAHLEVGQTLDDQTIAQLKKLDEVERSYNRALNFLSYRPRSEAEVRRNLRKKDVPDEAIEAVVERLTRAGLLDDEAFARYWVDNRLRFKPRGRRALRQELWEKGVPDPVIAEALADVDEESAARKAAEAGARRLARRAPPEFRRKLKAYLARRGFSYDVIKPLVEEMLRTRCKACLQSNESEEDCHE